MAKQTQAAPETDWLTITSRGRSGSPGSGDWTEHLCWKRSEQGVELAVCGYEVDAEGEETENFIVDPGVIPELLSALDRASVEEALSFLGWDEAQSHLILAALINGSIA